MLVSRWIGRYLAKGTRSRPFQSRNSRLEPGFLRLGCVRCPAGRAINGSCKVAMHHVHVKIVFYLLYNRTQTVTVWKAFLKPEYSSP